MICFECKENHPNKKTKQPSVTTAQIIECDHCGREGVCYPDYKVIELGDTK